MNLWKTIGGWARLGEPMPGSMAAANQPSLDRSASISGTAPGAMIATVRIHATSLRLRSTGARQSAATFNRASARLTQKRRVPAVTRVMSDETPPVSGSISTASPAKASPARTSSSANSLIGSGTDSRASG